MINSNELELLLTHDNKIDFAPASIESEIMQNITTIFATSKYSVPLDREFGLNTELLDQPQSVIEALLAAEIVESIEKYEPRVKITEVRINLNNNGEVSPVIKFVIKT